jgi:enterochelin esterase family protein
MVAISIGNGGGDAQGSERGLEYDTMSGKYAEWVETEVLPLVEAQAHVKLTDDPDGRATMGAARAARRADYGVVSSGVVPPGADAVGDVCEPAVAA